VYQPGYFGVIPACHATHLTVSALRINR
jgi:hypothetical protein